MTIIGLVLRTESETARALGNELVEWGTQNGCKVLLEHDSAVAMGKAKQGVPAAELVTKADPIVTLGGDGTLISAARFGVKNPPVFLGVNFGTLGFLTEVRPDELFPVLESVLSNKAKIGTRAMLQASVHRSGKQIFLSNAINEALVQKGSRDRLLDLDLEVEGEEVMRLRADGLIVATPTGSTAYSLAAGGSIAYPLLDTFLLTPICAHSLTARPLILPMDFNISILVPDYTGEVFLSLDGAESCELEAGDRIEIVRSKFPVRFVQSPSRSYFEILRQKLNWGATNTA